MGDKEGQKTDEKGRGDRVRERKREGRKEKETGEGKRKKEKGIEGDEERRREKWGSERRGTENYSQDGYRGKEKKENEIVKRAIKIGYSKEKN